VPAPERTSAATEPRTGLVDQAVSLRRVSGRAVSALVARPFATLSGLVVVHWLAVLAFALTVRHNGWAYYQGGDQIVLTATGWMLADAELAPTYVGYGWPLVLAPLNAVTGPSYVAAMPAVVVLNVLVLAPLVLWAVHGIACRIAGRAFGLFAAALWVAAPFMVIPLWRGDYHERYVEQFLPQALGLNALADYPSLVLLIVGTYLFVRALDTGAVLDAAAAGIVVGFAIGTKPSNSLFLAAPVAASLVARKWRPALAFGLALLPALLALAVWKQRGLGTLPLFALEETRLAAGALSVPNVDRYLDVDWAVLEDNDAHLREYFWSARLLEWLPLAGLVGIARRAGPLAALLGVWFGVFLLFKGSNELSRISSGSFFRFMMPAYPAYFLLAAGVLLLVPTAGRRLTAAWPAAPLAPIGKRVVALLAAGLAALPLMAVALAQPDRPPPETIFVNNILTPVDPGIRISVRVEGEARVVTWGHPSAGRAAVFYRVFRTAAEGEDVVCVERSGGAAECTLQMLLLGTTRQPHWRDGSPPPGAQYRIGIGTNAQDDPSAGDVFLISRPADARVP
jgi:hypothetical protein